MSATQGHFHGRGTGDVTVDVDVEAEERAKRRLRGKKKNRHLITSAQYSPEQNRRSRETQYLIMQGLRLPFIILCLLAVFAWHNWWLGAIFFAISVPLPWISVMVANGHGEVRDTRTKNVYKPAAIRAEQQLEAQRQAQLGPAGQAGPGGAVSIIDHDDHA